MPLSNAACCRRRSSNCSASRCRCRRCEASSGTCNISKRLSCAICCLCLCRNASCLCLSLAESSTKLANIRAARMSPLPRVLAEGAALGGADPVDEEGCVADLVGCVGMGSGRLSGSGAGSDCVLKVAAGRGVGGGRGVEAFIQCRRSSSLCNRRQNRQTN